MIIGEYIILVSALVGTFCFCFLGWNWLTKRVLIGCGFVALLGLVIRIV